MAAADTPLVDEGLAFLGIIGETPQVVTSSLYAMKKLPGRIVIITTQIGAIHAGDRLRERILELYRMRSMDFCDVPDAFGFGSDSLRIVPCSVADIVWDSDANHFRRKLDEEVLQLRNGGYRIHMGIDGGRNAMVAIGPQVLAMHGKLTDTATTVQLVPPEVMKALNSMALWWPGRCSEEGKAGNVVDLKVLYWDKETGKYATQAESLTPAEVEVRLVDVTPIPFSVLAPGVAGMDAAWRRHLYRAAVKPEYLEVKLDTERRRLRISHQEFESEIVIGMESGDAPARTPQFVGLQSKELALLWWIATESAKDRVRGAMWRRRAFESLHGDDGKEPEPSPFKRYLRIVAWLCEEGREIDAISDDFLAGKVQGSSGATGKIGAKLLLWPKGGEPEPYIDKIADWPMLQDWQHLVNGMEPLGPLAGVIAGSHEFGARVDPEATIVLDETWSGLD